MLTLLLIGVVIVALILWWGPTPATRQVIPALLLIALLVLGVELLRRQTAREFPDASREAEALRRREWWARRRSGRAGTEASGGDPTLQELTSLGQLRDTGVLSQDEFEREKRRILKDRAVPPQPA